jgi:hypothetical protein
MPAVIIKMLVASALGKIQLLPALPKAWPTGTIEGVLCRGQVEIKRLHWKEGRIEISLVSAIKQSLTLEAPFEIRTISIKKGSPEIQDGERNNSRTLLLPARQEIALEIQK